MKSFKEGMEAGARPFEEKFEQQAVQLENLGKDMRDGINSLGNIQDELIDISEEQEEKIESIDKKVQLGLDEREELNMLSEREKEILGGMILKLSQERNFNDSQKEFVSNVLRSLGLSNPQIIELDVIENIENIKVQKVIFRVLSELLFLGENSFESAKKLSEWFAINKRSRETIFDEIMRMSNAVGSLGLIKKYCVTAGEVKKRKKYPKLEINMKINEYKNYEVLFEAEVNMDDYWDMETYRTERECRNAIESLVHKYYNEQQRYVSPDGDRFVGKGIIKHYYGELEYIVNKIVDFVKVHNIKVDVRFLEDLMSTLEEELLNEMKEELYSGKVGYSVTHWNDYSDMILIEAVDDFVETIFGGFKEVKRYQESINGEINVYNVVEKMGEEINRIAEMLQWTVYSFVVAKCPRIEEFVRQINIKTGNE